MSRWVCLLALACMLLAPRATVSGQPKPEPTPTAPPQAPTLEIPFPLGGQRGQSVGLSLTGNNLADPIGLLANFPAKATFTPDKPEVTLAIAADATVGLHAIRIATADGVSNWQPFCVDDLTQVVEEGSHETLAAAQPVEVPCVIAGRIDAEKTDYFRFHASAGQRLSFDALARRVGSPLDPVITIYDAASGRELPGVYSDDAPGLLGDARLTHTFAVDGDYAVGIRDAVHAGGGGHLYRLRVGDFPCAITPFPLAVRRGTSAEIAFAGPHIDGASPVKVAVAEDAPAAVQVAPRFGDGPAGWPVELMISDVEELIEVEPNDAPERATPVAADCGVSARFLDRGDVDHFRFPATKDRKVTVTARTYELRSPAEVYLIVKSADGKELAKSKPEEDPLVEFTPPEDGDYLLVAEHLNFLHGPNEVYRLEFRSGEPDFEVILSTDRSSVPGVIPIQSVARAGYDGPVEIRVSGLGSGLSGSVTVPAGRSSLPDAPVALLELAGDAEVGGHPIRIQAVGRVGDREIVRYARLGDDALRGRMSDIGVPARSLAEDIAAGVTAPPPFSLTPEPKAVTVVRGKSEKITLRVGRNGYDEEINLQAAGVPKDVALKFGNVAKGADSVEVTVEANGNAPKEPFAVTIKGSAKVGGKDVAVYSTPVTIDTEAEPKK